MGTLTSLSSRKTLGAALACWISIEADVGSTSNLDGAKMLKLEPKCKTINVPIKTLMRTQTSTLFGLIVSSMATIVSM